MKIGDYVKFTDSLGYSRIGKIVKILPYGEWPIFVEFANEWRYGYAEHELTVISDEEAMLWMLENAN